MPGEGRPIRQEVSLRAGGFGRGKEGRHGLAKGGAARQDLAVTDFQRGTRAVIFDLDGVIADTEPLHQQAFRRLLDELGLREVWLEDWHRYIGTADRPVMIELTRGYTGPLSLEELLDRKAGHFLDLVREREPLYPPIPDLVTDMARRYTLAVASGSMRVAIAGVLGLRGLRQHFRTTLSVQDVGRGKPAPDLFLRASEAIGISPAECVVIEDSNPGVTAARAAGMRVIAITNTTPAERLAAADAVVTDYTEVRRLLLG